MAEQLSWIPVNKIKPNRYQPRREFKAKELEELAESIDAQGLIQPIIIRPMDDLEDGCEYELIAGERRWRAVKDILGKEKIRAIVRTMDEESSQEAAIIENLQRQDLNPIEEAVAIQKLMERNSLTQDQVAKKLGKSRSYVANVVRLNNLNKEIQQLVSTGQLDKAKAWTLLAITDEKSQMDMAKRIIEKDWNVEKVKLEVEKEVAKNADPEKKVVRKMIDGKIVTVASPSKSPRGKGKNKNKASTLYFVLVELDSAETVKDFISYMGEQEWKCWDGLDAIKQLENLKKTQESIEKQAAEKQELENFEELEDLE